MIKHIPSQLLLALASAAILLPLLGSLFLLKEAEQTVTPPVSVQQTEPYLLKAYQGKLALYLPPSNTPEEIYDIYLNTLPQADQIQLEKGIYLTDLQQVETYLEDFDS